MLKVVKREITFKMLAECAIYTKNKSRFKTYFKSRSIYSDAIEIGDDVWIGGSAIICSAVIVGNRSVIGAGSVVTKDIPDECVCRWYPCRVLRNIV